MFSAGGCKGKGKGKGKGSPELGKGHTLPKVRISAEKFTGTVSAWKGKYGWIQPAETIEHEKANMHNGGLFVSMDYVIGRTDLEVGAPVAFHICEDESGLGAEEVVQTGPAPRGAAAAAKGQQGKGFAKGPAFAKGKDAGKASSKGAYGGKPAAAAPAAWGGKGWTAPAATKPMDSGKWGKGKFDNGKGKGKGKDGMKGKGHTLPRTRITAEKFLGTVIAWKGKYGWIQPAEEIPHEKASKNKGGLFVSMDDIMGVQELTAGATVEFHIWEDSTGLGAEEVVQS